MTVFFVCVYHKCQCCWEESKAGAECDTLREGLLPGRTAELAGGCSTNSEEEPGEGKECIGTFWSSWTASWFSWELRGSTASLLGTGVRAEGRLAKESELDFVVSWRVDEGVAEALEKKPKMLFCFPADDDDNMAVAFLAVDGVLAGVCRGFSDWLTMAAGATAQLVRKRQ